MGNFHGFRFEERRVFQDAWLLVKLGKVALYPEMNMTINYCS